MKSFRVVILIFFCIMVAFVQSEKLPKYHTPFVIAFTNNEGNRLKIKSGELNILSYNTWGLPIELKGHDHNRRFTQMGDSLLNSKSDILALQEVFHPQLRTKILDVLTKEYYILSDYYCNKEILPYVQMDCFGGLMTLSKYPIISEQFYKYPIFDDCTIIEKIGAKGFLLSHIAFGNKVVNVINTHLYAGDHAKAEKMRLEQIKFMFEVLNELPDFFKNQTLLIGDFNVDHPSVEYSPVYEFITQNMGFEDSKTIIDQNDFTIDHIENKFVPKVAKRTKLDYVFLKSPNASIEVKNQCRTMVCSEPLSDHFGWLVHLKLLDIDSDLSSL